MWVKYRHNFAWGSNKEWTYIEIPDMDYLIECDYTGDDNVGEWLMHEERVGDDYAYSDKYRGIDWEFVEKYPPYEEIEKRLKLYKDKAIYWNNEAERFQNILDEMGTITKEDTDI